MTNPDSLLRSLIALWRDRCACFGFYNKIYYCTLCTFQRENARTHIRTVRDFHSTLFFVRSPSLLESRARTRYSHTRRLASLAFSSKPQIVCSHSRSPECCGSSLSNEGFVTFVRKKMKTISCEKRVWYKRTKSDSNKVVLILKNNCWMSHVIKAKWSNILQHFLTLLIFSMKEEFFCRDLKTATWHKMTSRYLLLILYF